MSDSPQVRVPPRGSPSVSRAVAILNLISQRPGGWSLTQIASALGLAKSSTLTIMTSLEAAGMVSRSDGDYDLDVGVLAPASSYLRGTDVVSQFKKLVVNSPLLRTEMAHLALLADNDVTYIARHIGRAPLPVTAGVGDRFPASITAVGTILLAQLSDDEIAHRYREPGSFPRWSTASTADLPTLMAKINRARVDGYSIDNGETHPNVFAYGLLVHREGNHAQDLAMSTSLLKDTATVKKKAQALAELRAIRDTLETGNELR